VQLVWPAKNLRLSLRNVIRIGRNEHNDIIIQGAGCLHAH
jgi:hypothetical protein